MKTTTKNRCCFDVLPWKKIFVTNKSSENAPYDQNNMNIIRNKCIIRSKQHTSFHAMYVNNKNNHEGCLTRIKEYKSEKCNHQESWLELVEVG